MWVFTGWGALFPSQRPEGTIPEGDDKTIQIRARRKIELQRACEFYPEVGILAEDIIFMPKTDYEFRIYCTPVQLGILLAGMALDINYTKFKPTTETFGESKLHDAYNQIWWILYEKFSTNRYLSQKIRSTGKQRKERPVKKDWWEDME